MQLHTFLHSEFADVLENLNIVIPSSIKSVESTFNKAFNQFGGDVSFVLDMARASVVCNSVRSLALVVKQVRASYMIF